MLEEHYAPLRRGTAKTYVVLAEQFLARFPDQAYFLEGLVAQHKLNPASHLHGIMELAALYDQASLERAFALAHEYTTYSHGFVRGLLEGSDHPSVAGPGGATATPGGSALPATSVEIDLGAYQRLLEAVR